MTVAIAGLMLSTTLLAQGSTNMPHGRWWKRPEVAQRLKLSAEQQSRLDAIAREAGSQLIDLRASLEKGNLDLREELDRAQPVRAEVQKAATRVSDARARIFDREVLLLLDMRAAITEEQWKQLRSALDHAGAQKHRNQMPRNNRHRPQGPRGRP